jgi:hypothetical protein
MNYMMPIASLLISILAIIISATTAWLTLFRRGTVRMTQPTTIYFGCDGGVPDDGKIPPKIFLRTLLYATSKRGRIIENMFVRLQRGETSQTFNIWVYGETKLSRGSGLYVGQDGVTFNHHFIPPDDAATFEFRAGAYTLEVYTSLVGSARILKLFTVRLPVSEHVAEGLRNSETGVFFDWGPDSHSYHSHVRKRPADSLPGFLLDAFKASPAAGGKSRNRKKKTMGETGSKPISDEPKMTPSE